MYLEISKFVHLCFSQKCSASCLGVFERWEALPVQAGVGMPAVVNKQVYAVRAEVGLGGRSICLP